MGGRRREVVEPTPTPAAAAEDCGLEFSEAGRRRQLRIHHWNSLRWLRDAGVREIG
jgi:hypothetical protein